MQIDQDLIFCENLAVDGMDEITVSTNVIDLGPVDIPYGSLGAFRRDLGAGVPHDIDVRIATAVTGGTSLKVQWFTADQEAFGDEVLVAESVDVPVANLRAGYQFNIPNSVPEKANGRYHRLKFVSVGTITAGAVSAYWVKARDTAQAARGLGN